MLRLIVALLPARLHIAGLRTAHAVRLRWWKLAGSKVRGCRVLVLDAEERVLLIRHSYGSGQWMLPGGGLGRREDPVTGGAREVREETGVRLYMAVSLGRTDDPASLHETHLIAGWTDDQPRPDGREILEAGFFPADALPPNRSERVAALLANWLRAAKAARPAD